MFKYQFRSQARRSLFRFVAGLLTVLFSVMSVCSPSQAQTLAASLQIPPLTTLPSVSSIHAPLLRGLSLHPENGLRLDFIFDQGDQGAIHGDLSNEASRLIKYFLAALTIRDEEMWVNLSPYERDRIMGLNFRRTEMGLDLLAEDFFLKQMTAALLNPEHETGEAFWEKMYRELDVAGESLSDRIDLFNKVWIVPETAVIVEGKQSVFIVEAKLKVMMEDDYVALDYHDGLPELPQAPAGREAAIRALREVVLPVIENEVNTGAGFVRLRQIYHSLILARWYKQKFKDALLARIYTNQNLTQGVEIDEPGKVEELWARYVSTFEDGVYDIIRDDYDPVAQDLVSRRYFSGGANLVDVPTQSIPSRTMDNQQSTGLSQVSVNLAMLADETRTADSGGSGTGDAIFSESEDFSADKDKNSPRWRAAADKDRFYETVSNDEDIEVRIAGAQHMARVALEREDMASEIFERLERMYGETVLAPVQQAVLSAMKSIADFYKDKVDWKDSVDQKMQTIVRSWDHVDERDIKPLSVALLASLMDLDRSWAELIFKKLQMIAENPNIENVVREAAVRGFKNVVRVGDQDLHRKVFESVTRLLGVGQMQGRRVREPAVEVLDELVMADTEWRAEVQPVLMQILNTGLQNRVVAAGIRGLGRIASLPETPSSEVAGIVKQIFQAMTLNEGRDIVRQSEFNQENIDWGRVLPLLQQAGYVDSGNKKNPDFERLEPEFREQHPELAVHFEALERLLKNPSKNIRLATMEAFRRIAEGNSASVGVIYEETMKLANKEISAVVSQSLAEVLGQVMKKDLAYVDRIDSWARGMINSARTQRFQRTGLKVLGQVGRVNLNKAQDVVRALNMLVNQKTIPEKIRAEALEQMEGVVQTFPILRAVLVETLENLQKENPSGKNLQASLVRRFTTLLAAADVGSKEETRYVKAIRSFISMRPAAAVRVEMARGLLQWGQKRSDRWDDVSRLVDLLREVNPSVEMRLLAQEVRAQRLMHRLVEDYDADLKTEMTSWFGEVLDKDYKFGTSLRAAWTESSGLPWEDLVEAFGRIDADQRSRFLELGAVFGHDQLLRDFWEALPAFDAKEFENIHAKLAMKFFEKKGFAEPLKGWLDVEKRLLSAEQYPFLKQQLVHQLIVNLGLLKNGMGKNDGFGLEESVQEVFPQVRSAFEQITRESDLPMFLVLRLMGYLPLGSNNDIKVMRDLATRLTEVVMGHDTIEGLAGQIRNHLHNKPSNQQVAVLEAYRMYLESDGQAGKEELQDYGYSIMESDVVVEPRKKAQALQVVHDLLAVLYRIYGGANLRDIRTAYQALNRVLPEDESTFGGQTMDDILKLNSVEAEVFTLRGLPGRKIIAELQAAGLIDDFGSVDPMFKGEHLPDVFKSKFSDLTGDQFDTVEEILKQALSPTFEIKHLEKVISLRKMVRVQFDQAHGDARYLALKLDYGLEKMVYQIYNSFEEHDKERSRVFLLMLEHLELNGYDSEILEDVITNFKTFVMEDENTDKEDRDQRIYAVINRADRVIHRITDTTADIYSVMAERLAQSLGGDKPTSADRKVTGFADAILHEETSYLVTTSLASMRKKIRQRLGREDWTVVVPGEAMGRMIYIENPEDLASFDPLTENDILVAHHVDGEHRAFSLIQGVMVLVEGSLQSHIVNRCRTNKIPYYVAPDIEALKKYFGKYVHIVHQGDRVEIKEMTEEEFQNAKSKGMVKEETGAVHRIDYPRMVSSSDKLVIRAEDFQSGIVGNKAANYHKMMKGVPLLEGEGSLGYFSAPADLFQRLLDLPENSSNAQIIRENIQKLKNSDLNQETAKNLLAQIKELTERLEFPQNLVRQISREGISAIREMTGDFLSKDEDFYVFARSSSNVEDLKGYPGGGLFESHGPLQLTDLNALRQRTLAVIASQFTPKAWEELKSRFDFEEVFVSVFYLQLADPALSFLMYTESTRQNGGIFEKYLFSDEGLEADKIFEIMKSYPNYFGFKSTGESEEDVRAIVPVLEMEYWLTEIFGADAEKVKRVLQRTTNPDEMVLEIAQGYGEILVGNSEGNPHRVIYNKRIRKIRWEVYSDKDVMIARQQNDFITVPVKSSKDPFWRDGWKSWQKVLRLIFEMGLGAQSHFGGPQDIEGAIIWRDGKLVPIRIQTRAQEHDRAMISRREETVAPVDSGETLGGIDLNPRNWDLDVRASTSSESRALRAAEMNTLPDEIFNIPENLTGLTPVIINVLPVTNLPLLLGLAEIPTSPTEISRVDAFAIFP